MPWCPRCDETFPEGPSCPRCSARLVQKDTPEIDDTLESIPSLRSIKVSRRDRRALERLSGPRAPSARLFAFALVLLVFASGFLLGRVGGLGVSQPTVRSLPMAQPLAYDSVKGSLSYLVMSRDALATIARHDLYSGDVQPAARFSPPFEGSDAVDSRVVSFGRSIAAIVGLEGRSYVAMAAHGEVPHGWLPGVDAAWLSEDTLLVRRIDGGVERWTSRGGEVTSVREGAAERLIDTWNGAVLQRGETIGAPGRTTVLELPTDAVVLAVSPDMSRALLDGPRLWDGTAAVDVRVDATEIFGASFSRSGEEIAMLVRRGDERLLAIVDARGNAAFKPLGTGSGCRTAPAWDALGRWVYVASSSGVVHAVEAHGGRISTIRTPGTGCGIAWLGDP